MRPPPRCAPCPVLRTGPAARQQPPCAGAAPGVGLASAQDADGNRFEKDCEDLPLAALAARLPAAAPRYLRWIRAGRRGAYGELTEQVAVDDIVYIQADDKYTCVHVRDGAALRECLIRVPLTDLADDLDPADFAQIHRSVIVNLREVAGTRRDAAGKLHVRMRGQARELPVSRQYVHLFRQM